MHGPTDLPLLLKCHFISENQSLAISPWFFKRIEKYWFSLTLDWAWAKLWWYWLEFNWDHLFYPNFFHVYQLLFIFHCIFVLFYIFFIHSQGTFYLYLVFYFDTIWPTRLFYLCSSDSNKFMVRAKTSQLNFYACTGS